MVGNTNPALDRSNNAKEILLNVAGYFTRLNDVTISGVPDGVSIGGATNSGGGVWTLPAATVVGNMPFTIIYNMDDWRSTGSNTFDLDMKVSGISARGVTFETTQSFRFMYMDVTDVNQVTDPTLVYDSRGQAKQIYVLPTLGQPTVINSGEGDDIVYGGRNNDTITVGNGNDEIHADAGDDTVLTGNGNNVIDLGSGNNSLRSGSGNDRITATDGDNSIEAAAGTNNIALGNGNNTVTAGLGDDTLVAGDGRNTVNLGDGLNNVRVGNGINNITTGSGNDVIQSGTGAVTINAGAGANQITTGGGRVAITTGAGNDTITVNGGGGTITAGSGDNIIAATTGNYTIITAGGVDNITVGNGNNTIDAGDGNNTVNAGNGNNIIISGAGNDTLTAGGGYNIFRAGLGNNTITGGLGNNTVDYSMLTTTGVILSLAAGTATGTGLSDTLSGIRSAIGTSQNDTLTGNTGTNQIRGGAGNDIITGGGGNDTLYGEDGDDVITGGSGNDTIYAGNGNNTVYAGTSGDDRIFGGTGNNLFVSQHAGVAYDGTNGGNLLTGQVNTIDYSASTANMDINLGTGFGNGGLATGDTYAFTDVTGVNSINRIIGGSGNDTLTGSAGNDILEGGAGNDNFFGGAGNDTFIGGTGDNIYYGDLGADTIIGSTSGTDRLRYQNSNASIVLNLDSVSHSFVNSSGQMITVAAFSGSNKGGIAADADSFSNGDTFVAVTNNTSIDEFYGSSKGDIIWGGANGGSYYLGSGVDYFYGGASNELINYSQGRDRIDGGGGSDVFYTISNTGGAYDVAAIFYLDGNADINGNGVADYIDRNAGPLSSGGVNYTGFAVGRDTTLLVNIENLLGNQLNDFLVGDNNANIINGRDGSNTMYGLGGNDTIHAAIGSNVIDGGSGIDTVDFSNGWYGTGTTTAAYVFLGNASFYGASDKSYFYGGDYNFQARTGSSVFSTITNVENITGSGLNDVLYGDGNANTIRARSGDDIIAGNGSADLLYGENGNDTFLVTAGNVASTSLFDGGAGTDTVRAAGLNVTAGSIVNSKFSSIENLDVRNNASGNAYSMTANDIQGLADAGTSSNITLRLDSGDTFSISTGAGTGAMSFLVASSNATDTIYYLYSDANHSTLNSTNRVAIIDIHTGA